MRRILMAAALGAGLAGPTLADEYTILSQVQVRPPGAAGDARCDTTALLNLPAAWDTGDAIAVVLTAGAAYNPQRDALIAELLADEAGVLEVSAGVPAACAGRGPEAARPTPRAASLDAVFGSLLAARQEGGGLVVAIGLGQDGRLALAAVDEAEASAWLGPDGPRFAAALAIGDDRARFRLGAPQAAREQAQLRLGLLCEALGRSGGSHGAENGRACAADLEAGTVSVRAALQR